MKIALAHFRVGETDGVSLEMEKWKVVLEEMGHEVVFLAGSEGQTKAYVIPELHYKHPLNNKYVYNAYVKISDYDSEEQFAEEVQSFAKTIEDKLIDFIRNEQIDLLVPNNIWSLAWGLPAGIGFTNAVKATGVQCLAHHHDFHWERERYSNPTCSSVKQWIKEFFPPDLPNIKHVVINKLAQDELLSRRGIQAAVVPNVFDFKVDTWEEDAYNSDFRAAIGAKDNDLVILQATRVTERKAIELGIDVVAELQKPENLAKLKSRELYNGKVFDENSRIIYVLVGQHEAEIEYIEMLKDKARSLQVDMRFINDIVNHSRSHEFGQKVYSLWDAYVISDFVTYPSILEGWGNQLLEAVFARKPMVVYEYPVYVSDIQSSGFGMVSLGDTHTVNMNGHVNVAREKIVQAGKEIADVLTDQERYENTVDANYKIGKQFFSYEALYHYLAPLIDQ